MPVVPTALTITPLFDGTKRMTATGTVAVHETVAVTVVGVNDITDPNSPIIPPGLVLRLVSSCGRVEYARFPAETGDAWAASGANATCALALTTANMLLLFRCAAGNETREVEAELGNGVTSNLYGRARLVLQNWIQNPLDPVAGSSQLQSQITVIAGLLETHQHDADAEGESSFPHNNLSGREVAGCHPTIEADIDNLDLAVQAAASTAATASANASAALLAAQAAVPVSAFDGISFADMNTDAKRNTAIRLLLTKLQGA